MRLKVAPWVMLPNNQNSEKVYAEDHPLNVKFRTTLGVGQDPGYVGLDHSEQLEAFTIDYNPTPPPDAVLGNRWFQDHIEIGYTGRPGGPKDHVIFQLPYGSDRPNTWARDHLLGPGVGIYQLQQDLGEHDDGGNLEVLPPRGQYILGRIIIGQNRSQAVWDVIVYRLRPLFSRGKCTPWSVFGPKKRALIRWISGFRGKHAASTPKKTVNNYCGISSLRKKCRVHSLLTRIGSRSAMSMN